MATRLICKMQPLSKSNLPANNFISLSTENFHSSAATETLFSRQITAV